MKILGVTFAPLAIPLERRLQTLAAMHFSFIFLGAPIVSTLSIIALMFTDFYWIALLYVLWIFFDNNFNQVSSTGGRRYDFFRYASIWKYFRDYFPITLVKTADLDPTKNYIMGYHPHGIIGCGAVCNFATESTNFSRKYPGVTPYLLTLTANFNWPLLRAYVMSLGICDVSRQSVEWITTKQGVGNAAVIVIGGADEALEAKPGNYILTLKNRKGFCKIAMTTGSSLVPVFSFGENELFVQADNPMGSSLRQFQNTFKKIAGFSPPMFHGRGIFNYSFGFLPFRTPVHTVVGKPIDVEQCSYPSQEQVDNLHQKYLDSLSELFDNNKSKYGISKSTHLQFT